MRLTTIVIPARLNSGRVPQKVLQRINGKPMLEHVWDACKQASQEIDADVVIGADHPNVARAAIDFGAKVMMTGPHVNGSERVAEVAHSLGYTNGDWLINVQADHAGITPEAIVEFYGTLIYSPASYHALYCAYESLAPDELDDKGVVKVVVADNRALYFTREPVPIAYKHSGIYGYTGSFLKRYLSWGQGAWEQAESLEQMRVLENGCTVFCSPLSCSTGRAINTAADLLAS